MVEKGVEKGDEQWKEGLGVVVAMREATRGRAQRLGRGRRPGVGRAPPVGRGRGLRREGRE